MLVFLGHSHKIQQPEPSSSLEKMLESPTIAFPLRDNVALHHMTMLCDTCCHTDIKTDKIPIQGLQGYGFTQLSTSLFQVHPAYHSILITFLPPIGKAQRGLCLIELLFIGGIHQLLTGQQIWFPHTQATQSLTHQRESHCFILTSKRADRAATTLKGLHFKNSLI